MIQIEIPVANTSLLLTAGAYGPGALLRWESSALVGGPYVEQGTVPLVSGQSLYDIFDTNGTVLTFYRWRLSNAGATTYGPYSAPFQSITTPVVTPQQVRDYMTWSESTDTRYSDTNIARCIRAGISFLEKETRRFLADRDLSDTSGVPWAWTTMIAAEVPIPGFRDFTQVTWGGANLTVALPGTTSGGCWAVPDLLASGVYTALQFRAWRTSDFPQWYLAHSDWFDQMYDSPYFPGNFGGGFAWTSMPNDLCIWGHAGYASGSEPYSFILALQILAAYYVMRPASVLATLAMTPGGSTVKYGDLPSEVRDFIAAYQIGQVAVSVG